MALTGLDIYKHLPKTNCGKCGSPTCLAFAMKLAAKKASLEECPDITQEAKMILSDAQAPPIASVSLGINDDKIELGGEVVLFRHDKTFYHPTGIAIRCSDAFLGKELEERVEKINKLVFERIGQTVRVNLIALENETGDPKKFAEAAAQIQSKTQLPLILMAQDLSALEGALKICSENKPLIYAANAGNYEAMTKLAKDYKTPLAVYGKGLEELASLTEKIAVLGHKELVLDAGSRQLGQTLSNLTNIRRLALKKNFRPLGFPVIAFTDSPESFLETAQAATYILKYASIVVLRNIETWEHLPLVSLRQNIYTDPQKPIAVEAKLYEIGGTANPASPLMITTNFSLTYFTVAPEIEAAKLPAYLLVIDSEGMSVLTAWAAEKFTAEQIVATIQKFEVDKKLSHKKIIIPGYVAVMKGKLEDESGWEVIVGPREASGIPAFMKANWK
ncbi:MAG: acetyl-CoA decarbonylase/synthase complex subunit gamma [Candidatus Omnitrophota bacterium]